KTDSEVGPGYATRGKARCPACPMVLSGQRVRSQLALERGGGSPRFSTNGERIGGARLIAVITTTNESSGRMYRLPEKRDYQAYFLAWQQPLSNLPTEQINPVRPSPNARGLSAVTRFGITTFSDLYSRRQIEAMRVLSHEVGK